MSRGKPAGSGQIEGKQLSLFGPADAPPPYGEVQAVIDPDAIALAARLPSWLRMGTSSWTFPGWAGLVYAGHPSQAALVRSGLSAYARHPLFRTVGIDRSFYAPLSREDLDDYSRQLASAPPGFLAVPKMWEELSVASFPNHARYGARAGTKNPRFLDAALAREIAASYMDAFAAHLGPLLFEFSPMGAQECPDPTEFARRLDALFETLPSGLRVAVELRNRELLTPRYLDVLRAHGVAHVLNFWSAMPRPGEQLRLPGVLTAPFVVARLSLPPGTRYADRAAAFHPFNRLVDPQLVLRAEIVELLRASAPQRRDVFVLVNNKVEGSSPLTIKALAVAITDAFSPDTPF